MSQRAKGPQEARDKGTEGSRVTSCPCVDETMPSVNKPKLCGNDRGWVNKRQPFEMQSVINLSQYVAYYSDLAPLRPFYTLFIVS